MDSGLQEIVPVLFQSTSLPKNIVRVDTVKGIFLKSKFISFP